MSVSFFFLRFFISWDRRRRRRRKKINIAVLLALQPRLTLFCWCARQNLKSNLAAPPHSLSLCVSTFNEKINASGFGEVHYARLVLVKWGGFLTTFIFLIYGGAQVKQSDCYVNSPWVIAVAMIRIYKLDRDKTTFLNVMYTLILIFVLIILYIYLYFFLYQGGLWVARHPFELLYSGKKKNQYLCLLDSFGMHDSDAFHPFLRAIALGCFIHNTMLMIKGRRKKTPF